LNIPGNICLVAYTLTLFAFVDIADTFFKTVKVAKSRQRVKPNPNNFSSAQNKG
jgi:hypothetical protein